MRILPRQVESLWTLFTAPVLWAFHFLLCYVIAAVFCAKAPHLDLGFDAVRLTILVVTLVVLLLIAFSGLLAWRQWGFGVADPPHDDPNRNSRTLFQGFATLLLCGLSFIAVIYVALPALFITECVR